MIEQTIYEFLKSNPNISGLLTKYNGIPAVFNRESPADTDELWSDGPQYPRLVFELSMQEDPERKISGILSVDLYLDTSGGLFVENVEPIIRDEISGCFFSDETDTISANWRQSDAFVTPEDGNRVNGVTVTFDIISFPDQHTGQPDPVLGAENYAKAIFPDCVLIGTDEKGKAWRSTDDTPALYVRLKGITPSSFRSTYHCTWHNAQLSVHVIAPSSNVRNSITKKLIEQIQQDTRIFLPDTTSPTGQSPMFVQRISVTSGADQMREGQIGIDGNYGVLRTYPDVQKMNNISIE